MEGRTACNPVSTLVGYRKKMLIMYKIHYHEDFSLFWDTIKP